MNDWETKSRQNERKGRMVGGLIIVGIGVVLLARKMGADIPGWLFRWEVLLIALGIYVGVRHNFRTPAWWIMVLVGCVFLLDNIFPAIPIKPFIFPALIIALGLYLIFRPSRRRGHSWKKWEDAYYNDRETSPENYIDSTAVFGGIKKNIISKDFKGGEITCVFGGAEINLSQADINGTVVLEATQVFGGTKLIVPSHWQVQPEMTAILGGIEDKRPLQPTDPNKILILKGTSVFGGLELRSY